MTTFTSKFATNPMNAGGLTPEWNDRIVAAIQKAESRLPNQHLIAQGFPPSERAIADLNGAVSVLNFHAAHPESVLLNYSLDKVIAFDETGGSDTSDRKYRTEGWDFIIAGGGVYDHLDFSLRRTTKTDWQCLFRTARPAAADRKCANILPCSSNSSRVFDFLRMTPSDAVIQRSTIRPAEDQQRSRKNQPSRVLAEVGKAYAIYVNGGTQAELMLDLPAEPIPLSG